MNTEVRSPKSEVRSQSRAAYFAVGGFPRGRDRATPFVTRIFLRFRWSEAGSRKPEVGGQKSEVEDQRAEAGFRTPPSAFRLPSSVLRLLFPVFCLLHFAFCLSVRSQPTPSLSISFLGPGLAEITWPTNFAGWQLTTAGTAHVTWDFVPSP